MSIILFAQFGLYVKGNKATFSADWLKSWQCLCLLFTVIPTGLIMASL